MSRIRTGGLVIVSALAMLVICGAAVAIDHGPVREFDNDGVSVDAGLPYFDIRVNAQGQPMDWVLADQAAIRAGEGWAKRQAARARLEARFHGVRMDDEAIFLTPNFIRSTEMFLTPPSQLDPKAVARTFVSDYRDLFEVDPAELDNARMSRDYVTDHNGVRHLTFQQQINGL